MGDQRTHRVIGELWNALTDLRRRFREQPVHENRYVAGPLRNGGSRKTRPVRRKYRSSLNQPSETPRWRSRLVAATMRTSTVVGVVAPTR